MGSVYSSSREMFEQRMRLRRAATCLAAARSHVASGKLVEAVDRLEEACALDPSASEARLLLEELRAHETAAPPPAESSRPRSDPASWSPWLAAGIAVCALAALAVLWPWDRPHRDGGGEPAHQAPALAPPRRVDPPVGDKAQGGRFGARLAGPAGTTGQGTAQREADQAPVGSSEESVAIQVTEARGAGRPVQSPPADVPLAPDAARGAGRETALAALPSTTSPGTMSSAAPIVAAPQPLPPVPPLERVPVAAGDLARLVTSEATASSPVSPAAGRPADVPSLHGSVDDADAIGAILRRYAEAYARLDAAAARAVWPTVDERALARAFDGLQAQGIVFDHCDVALDGAEATAACRGRASFVPKVGSRSPLVVRRQWTFLLRKAGAAWEILRAEAK